MLSNFLILTRTGFERRNILNDDKLRNWLGDQSIIDPQTLACTDVVLTRKDPRCRFMYVCKTTSFLGIWFADSVPIVASFGEATLENL